MRVLLLLLLCALGSAVAAGDPPIRHFVFFARERERLAERSFLDHPGLAGAQLKYTWAELEPRKDGYDFAAVERDLQFLAGHGKGLWIQLQDSSFDARTILVPAYLRQEPAFHGGAAPEYADQGGPILGWVARRWDPAVRDRFARLLVALGRSFDGRIAGINLPETSIDFGPHPPVGFTPTLYEEGVIATMGTLRQAFPRSVAMQYANFMPGEWLPHEDRGHLRRVYESAGRLGVAVGAPDLFPHKPSQMEHAYRFMHELRPTVGIAVQDGNQDYVHPHTGRRVTVQELVDFASGHLGAETMFWCTEEPYYTRDVLPGLAPGSR